MELVARLFVDDLAGGIAFGATARSTALRSQLREGATFRDYLMEGFITYDLSATAEAGGVLIEVRPHGTARDRYLESHIRWILRSAGVDDGDVR